MADAWERKHRYLAVIPCRAGSERLPNKNVGVKLGGRLLFEWTAEAAVESGVFDKVVVISNGNNVLARADEMPGVTTMVQPFEVAHPTATSESVEEYVVSKLEAEEGERFDYVALLQITSPLRTGEDIRDAVKGMEEAGADVCISGSVDTGFHWDRYTGWPIDFDDGDRPPTAERVNRIRENGAIYITAVGALKKTMLRTTGTKRYMHVMQSWKDIDIDYQDDLDVAERMMGYEEGVDEN